MVVALLAFVLLIRLRLYVKANSMKLIASLKYLSMYARCQNGPHLSLPPKSASCMRWRRCSGPGPLSLHAALSATMLPP